MISPVYILSKEDYENLVYVLTSIKKHVEDAPDCQAKSTVSNCARIGLFLLGKDTDA